MTTPKGRSGSLNPGRAASPYQLANTGDFPPADGRADGPSSPSPDGLLTVTRLRRISESQPTAWEGVVADGRKVHIAYRFGEVTVDLLDPLPGRPGMAWWVQVARFKPAEVEAEVRGKTPSERYALRLMAERERVAEIRRSNEADMRRARQGGNGDADILLNRARLVIRDGQLVRWLEERNESLALLIRRGVAGGRIPVRVQFDARSH